MISKYDIPFYEECSFGYYEWFVRKSEKDIVLIKEPILAPYKEIISDKSYYSEIKISPRFNYEKLILIPKHDNLNYRVEYLSRIEAYRTVKKYWREGYSLDWLRIELESGKIVLD